MLPIIAGVYIIIGGFIGTMIGGFWLLPVIGGVIGYMQYLGMVRDSIINNKMFLDIKFTTNSKQWIAGLFVLVVLSLVTGLAMLIFAGVVAKGRITQIKDEIFITVFLATLFICIASIIVPLRAMRRKRPVWASIYKKHYNYDEDEVINQLILKKDIDSLIALLKDAKKDAVHRKKAVKALVETKDPRAVGPLIATLKDKDPLVRTASGTALGENGDNRAIEPLIAVLKDDDYWYARQEAAKALQKIAGKDFGEDQDKWREWWEKNKVTIQKSR
jgi:hypothetical protein